MRQSPPIGPRQGVHRVTARTALLLGMCGLLVVAMVSALLLAAPQVHAAAAVSPLLWGENLSLESGTSGSDWFLANPALRTGLANAHTGIIRLPVRGPKPNQAGIANWTEVQDAATEIKAAGEAPLVILRNPQDPTLLADDSRVVTYMSSVFNGPSDTVYYEWANETDLSGSSYVSAANYVTSWNTYVPQLKTQAGPAAKWIGPVTSSYNPSFLQTFLQSANPRPDAVSWHEYSCVHTDSTAGCLSKIDNWTNHFAAARSMMTSILGTQIPIWITEWNFNAVILDQTTRAVVDTKVNDPTFLHQWTTKAMQVLAANGIAASMHYNVDGVVPLVNSDGSAAVEGNAYASQYEALIGSASTAPTPPASSPPSASPTPSAIPTTTAGSPTPSSIPTTTPPAGSSVRYSFEDDGLDGWSRSGNITNMANSEDVGGQDGSRSLEADFFSANPTDQPYVHVNPADGPTAGTPVTVYLWLPADGPTVRAQLYIQDSAYSWHTGAATTLGTHGAWVPLSFTPTGYTGKAIQIGVQLLASPANQTAKIYLDSVAW